MSKAFPVSDSNSYTFNSRKRPTKSLHNTLLTGDNSVYMWDMKGFTSFTCQLNNNGVSSNDQFTFEASSDGTNWTGIPVRLLGGRINDGIEFPDYVPLIFRLGNHNQGYIFGTNTYHRFIRLRYITVTPNRVLCDVHLSENNIPPIETNLSNFIEAQVKYTGSTLITTTADVQIAPALSPAFRQALIRLDVKNTGIGNGWFTIHELTTKVVLRNEYISAGERISLDLKSTPIVTTAGGKSLNFALVDTTNMSVQLNAVTINLLAQ